MVLKQFLIFITILDHLYRLYNHIGKNQITQPAEDIFYLYVIFNLLKQRITPTFTI